MASININNSNSTYGFVRSIQLSQVSGYAGRYLDASTPVQEIPTRVLAVANPDASILELRRVANALELLLDGSNRSLAAASGYLETSAFCRLGIHAELEFVVTSTGHGEVSNAILLVKTSW